MGNANPVEPLVVLPVIPMALFRALGSRCLSAARPSLFRTFSTTVDAEVAPNSVKSAGFSIVRHPVNDATLSASVEAGDVFAVIKLGATQFKVTQGDVVIAEKIIDAKVGTIMDIDEVLLIGSPNQTIVGRPFINGAIVQARVEEQTLDKKIDIFKKKRRKNYRRWNGYRREVTVLRVTNVIPGDL
ncbi:39S ribosomal protein L21, mitochondrial [Aphanomyces cochlioides]|nr:39S ribosomal protein L21, mitochondrial [Aphanomyces cochlioides]